MARDFWHGKRAKTILPEQSYSFFRPALLTLSMELDVYGCPTAVRPWGIHPSSDARRYATIRYRLLLANLLGSLLVLGLMQLSGFSHAIARWWSERFASETLVILSYLAAVGTFYELIFLPLNFYGSFLLEHRFGLSRMTLKQWLIREAKQLAIGALFGALLVEGLYALLRYASESWPLWATIGWVTFSVVLARMFPTLLLPIFYKSAPLQDESLAKRLLGLCQRAGIQALGVFRLDLGVETRKANAALAGLGKTRRVLLSDTLLEQFSADEIEGVLAHELGHQRFRHISKLLLINTLGSWVAFSLTALVGGLWIAPLGLRDLSDIAGFPTLALWFSLLSLLTLPLQQAISRHFEWQADRFAVATASQPSAFASALRKLSSINLADPAPPRWVELLFYDHPPITKRIAAAEK